MFRLVIHKHSNISSSFRQLPVKRTPRKFMQIKLRININHLRDRLRNYNIRFLVIKRPITHRQHTNREINIKLFRDTALSKLLRELITRLEIRQHYLHFFRKDRPTFRLQTWYHDLLTIKIAPSIHYQSLWQCSAVKALENIFVREVTKNLNSAVNFILDFLINHCAC